MSKDVYAAALRNTLREIRNICPDVTCSFVFTKDGTVVARDAQATETPIEKAVPLFQGITEKAVMIGGLDALLINGDNGKMYISCAEDMYLAMATSENADIAYLHSVTRVIVPTILRLLESIVPTPLKFVPSQQLTVDNVSGFRTRFASDTVQVDHEILEQWSKLFNGKYVHSVKIEAFGGKLARCKVKAIEDPSLEGNGLIRIPEKTCQTLEVKKGELVRVKPITP